LVKLPEIKTWLLYPYQAGFEAYWNISHKNYAPSLDRKASLCIV